MDVYLDRTVELGQQRPYGPPDFGIELGDHIFHVAEPGADSRTLPVRLSAAVYCGMTDVLYFVAQPQDEAMPARWVQLADLLHSPLGELPRLAFDPERIQRIAQANEEASIGPEHARLRGLSVTADADGRQQFSPDPRAQPRLLSGVRSADGQPVRLTATNALGLPTAGLSVSLDELTTAARQTALEWMSARHAALADIDALHALQPALRAISRARRQRQERGNPDIVTHTIQQHRARAHEDLSRLLDSLRQSPQD